MVVGQGTITLTVGTGGAPASEFVGELGSTRGKGPQRGEWKGHCLGLGGGWGRPGHVLSRSPELAERGVKGTAGGGRLRGVGRALACFIPEPSPK